jgi:hypothetical protein
MGFVVVSDDASPVNLGQIEAAIKGRYDRHGTADPAKYVEPGESMLGSS